MILPGETAHKYKFDENLNLELKSSGDETSLSAFQRVAQELGSEGDQYSINRESFIKFFNELTPSQQKEFLACISLPENQGKSIHDLAQEYNARLMRAKP